MRFSEILVLMIISGVVLSNPLVDFFSEIAGMRDYHIVVEMVFHVRDPETWEFLTPDPSITFEVAVRDMEDFYFKIREPEIFSGVEFAYSSSTGRLYSGFEGNYTMDVYNMPKSFVVDLVRGMMDSLREPLFSVNYKENDGEYVFSFEYTPMMLFIIKRLRIEPIKMKIVLSGNSAEPKELIFIGGEDEWVKMKFLKFEYGKPVDEFFKIVQGS